MPPHIWGWFQGKMCGCHALRAFVEFHRADLHAAPIVCPAILLANSIYVSPMIKPAFRSREKWLNRKLAFR